MILKISTDNLEGVHRATRLLADAINDPYLIVESLQPANSFLLRISTNLHSAAYARAIFRGGYISEMLGTEVTELDSDVERTGEAVFDEFLAAVRGGDDQQISAAGATLLDVYPSWRQATFTLERIVILKGRSPIATLQADPGPSGTSEMTPLIDKIKTIAKEKGILQKQLLGMSGMYGLSERTMRRILRGDARPTANVIAQLEDLLRRISAPSPTLAERIRQIRSERKLPLIKLAVMAGVNVSTLTRIERQRLCDWHR